MPFSPGNDARPVIEAFIPKARAETLHFAPKLQTLPVRIAPAKDANELLAAAPGFYHWQGAPEYKNATLALYQRKLKARGVTDTKLFVAQLIQEAGSLNPATIGDHGCSFGLIQYNACAKHRMSAASFLKKHPEWKTAETQLEWMADSVAWRMERYDSVRLAVIAHNSPAAAARGTDTKAGYYKAVSRRVSLLSL